MHAVPEVLFVFSSDKMAIGVDLGYYVLDLSTLQSLTVHPGIDRRSFWRARIFCHVLSLHALSPASLVLFLAIGRADIYPLGEASTIFCVQVIAPELAYARRILFDGSVNHFVISAPWCIVISEGDDVIEAPATDMLLDDLAELLSFLSTRTHPA